MNDICQFLKCDRIGHARNHGKIVYEKFIDGLSHFNKMYGYDFVIGKYKKVMAFFPSIGKMQDDGVFIHFDGSNNYRLTNTLKYKNYDLNIDVIMSFSYLISRNIFMRHFKGRLFPTSEIEPYPNAEYSIRNPIPPRQINDDDGILRPIRFIDILIPDTISSYISINGMGFKSRSKVRFPSILRIDDDSQFNSESKSKYTYDNIYNCCVTERHTYSIQYEGLIDFLKTFDKDPTKWLAEDIVAVKMMFG